MAGASKPGVRLRRKPALLPGEKERIQKQIAELDRLLERADAIERMLARTLDRRPPA